MFNLKLLEEFFYLFLNLRTTLALCGVWRFEAAECGDILVDGFTRVISSFPSNSVNSHVVSFHTRLKKVVQ